MLMKVGLIGTGLMGEAIALRLLEAGLDVVAYNRTAAKLQPLEDRGVAIASSVKDAIAPCDCTILMLADAPAIENIVLSADILPHWQGRAAIQMGTIGPRESQAIRDKIVAVGGEYMEAPVLGSIPQVKSGTLQIMVGGTGEQLQRCEKVLAPLGEAMLIGEVGAAAAVKLALNQLIASLTAAFGLSLSFIQRQGADVEIFMKILRDSALYAPTFDKKLQRMIDGNYADPNFPTKHLLKDTNLFINEAIASQLNVAGLSGVQEIIAQAITNLDLSDLDYSALVESIRNPS
ncbi:MAG: NAD(P)-dependent oxidoreductase [Limnospira sp. PMC 1291.21]|uniref:NAD(P)-dependent oxidoreductase n=1 Tax=Limnospira fusiformis PMC 851.14 TaxID=2219512 RepID=A0ABU9ESK0_LIMFS|nr:MULTISPECIES: NAD(P)-dependent oxidoreductase [Limnospira]MDY7053948.1 NAD(P)-dependent oxidoreductase [Limnospira fusiformis LS22]QJB28804.1 NAD(P)-dependent oxidoreductase [Limnospira fusiformis SAG 85.79]MDT9178340.1 NAD(P)-dependent oxidoreductase [Limnospira sp. PMC 1238.20]MDT9193613.1 NAD(P)-dependent oxidoreductase [Limnospira sp. PMC 1245.20]MDT9198546.1 NAD(P)-dependent oxidoreductase [Limnospira sp. PMC 1042.18]